MLRLDLALPQRRGGGVPMKTVTTKAKALGEAHTHFPDAAVAGWET